MAKLIVESSIKRILEGQRQGIDGKDGEAV